MVDSQRGAYCFIKNAQKNCNIWAPQLFSLTRIGYDICGQWHMSSYTLPVNQSKLRYCNIPLLVVNNSRYNACHDNLSCNGEKTAGVVRDNELKIPQIFYSYSKQTRNVKNIDLIHVFVHEWTETNNQQPRVKAKNRRRICFRVSRDNNLINRNNCLNITRVSLLGISWFSSIIFFTKGDIAWRITWLLTSFRMIKIWLISVDNKLRSDL